jgi:AraC-like DNA-binding protein
MGHRIKCEVECLSDASAIDWERHMTFILEERPADSAFVESIWQARCARPGSFISVAATSWEMVVTRYQGKTTFIIRGPETTATPLHYQSVGAEWTGIRFTLGTFMPLLLPRTLLDRRDIDLPAATCNSFWLHDAMWEFPNYENADTFVDRLTRESLLARDPIVDAVLQGQGNGASTRAIQYHFLRSTGLRYKTIRQIERARHVKALLEQGVSIPDAILTAGYFDQAHLSNSLKRFLGQTPTQIAREASTA